MDDIESFEFAVLGLKTPSYLFCVMFVMGVLSLFLMYVPAIGQKEGVNPSWPRLKATIEATVDPATGRVKGYLEEEHRAAVAKARGDWARSAADLLAAVDADADARAPAAAPAAAVEAK